MAMPLMPKATAVWLVENTTLTFDQIGEFCGMHPLEIQGIADGEVATGIRGQDPIAAGELSSEEIAKAEGDDDTVSELTDILRGDPEHAEALLEEARQPPTPDE